MPEFDKFEFMRKLAASKNGLEQDITNNGEDVTKIENSGEESQTVQEENSEKAYDNTNNGKSDVVICQGCGKKIGAKAKFCPNCGFTLGIETQNPKEDIKAENDTITDSNSNIDETEEENSESDNIKNENINNNSDTSEYNENDEQSENIEENKTDIIICQKCQNKCNNDDDFCGKCGNKLVKNTDKNTKYRIKCKNCGKEISSQNKFCPYCGFYVKVNNITNKTHMTVLCLAILVSSLFASIIYHVAYLYKKAPNCEANEVKDLVISIFKDNDSYYKYYITQDSINSIYIKYPAKTSYNKDIDKYFCTGKLIMTSTANGFVPKERNFDNDYYLEIRSRFGDDRIYHTYECDLEYTSQVSEGKTLVSANIANSWLWLGCQFK